MRSLNCLLTLVSIVLNVSLVDRIFAANYYVNNNHPKANDANYGTQSNLPIKSISAALSKAFPGDTVWVDSGTYRETILIPRSGSESTKSISIRALPKADVRIKGSDPVSGWVMHSGSIWKRLNWEVNSQQVFIDGFPLQQIGKSCPLNRQIFNKKPLLPPVGKGIGDMRPGSFFYDQKEKIIYIQLHDGSDPNKHLVEASVRDFIIPPIELNFIVLERLNFSHSNLTSKGLIMGIVNVWGQSWDISGCSFNFGDFAGMSVIGENHKISNNTFNNNGNLGISINGSDEKHKWSRVNNRPQQNIILNRNETSYNNYRNFELDWQHGGIKAAVSCNTVRIMRHKAIENNGAGIWFDIGCQNIYIHGCTIVKNLVGIAYEISDSATISNNLVVRNRYMGVAVLASDHVAVLNNTIVDNGFGVMVHGLPRSEHTTLKNNKILNNIISGSKDAELVIYHKPPAATDNTSDYNLFFHSNQKVKFSWTSDSSFKVNYTDLKSFTQATGQEKNSVNADPLWKNTSSDDYSLRPGSPAIDSGTTEVKGVGDEDFQGLPRIFGAKGSGTPRIDIGAYAFQGPRSLPASPQRK